MPAPPRVGLQFGRIRPADRNYQNTVSGSKKPTKSEKGTRISHHLTNWCFPAMTRAMENAIESLCQHHSASLKKKGDEIYPAETIRSSPVATLTRGKLGHTVSDLSLDRIVLVKGVFDTLNFQSSFLPPRILLDMRFEDSINKSTSKGDASSKVLSSVGSSVGQTPIRIFLLELCNLPEVNKHQVPALVEEFFHGAFVRQLHGPKLA